MALTEKLKKPKTRRQLLAMLESEIEHIRKRGNWLTATEDQRRDLISDQAFDDALAIIRKVADATMQEAVAYLKSKPPSFETIAYLAHVAPIEAISRQAKAAQNKRKGIRSSPYADDHANWLETARCSLPEKGTTATRRRAAVKAILETGTHASRRTVSAFVAAKWTEIAGRCAKADGWNLSV